RTRLRLRRKRRSQHGAQDEGGGEASSVHSRDSRDPGRTVNSPSPERFLAQAFRASALAGLVALLGLVDDVNAALAAHDLVVAVAPTQRLQRVADLHRSGLPSATALRTALS